ncbi:SubName: Full=Uncharacterized protein {ECO:0000313/EMBL:CCA68269.1} [Serendipita indica DSM 11827]|uniref:Uncharacterized protein n=1 Tax=Serendipita indica (strain DSM 11827) TaxID=1109443 RepID=G4TAE2_SERID|nr:SubName: Full=Uncharacterized protein {ECO:0000313/EMBL:CCA68269.1} [Serendipita indica DSM 11827]CCA68269.1 hypothetical protein PIIN_02134 [Serendipita indica DSM 11827]
MSYQEPAASGYELTAAEIDPAHHAIVPSDDQQDLAFRSIRALDPVALTPYGELKDQSVRRTQKGIRPMIWTLHTGQCVQVHVPYDSWRRATCNSEAVRAAIQKAYLNLLRHKEDPVIVKPGMISLKVLSKHDPQHRSTIQTLRQGSFDSNSTRASLDSSRYDSSHQARHSSHVRSRSQGSRTPHRTHSHPQPIPPAPTPIPPQPVVRPNVLTRLNTSRTMLSNASRSQPASPAHPSPYVSVTHSGQAPYVRVQPGGSGAAAGYDPYSTRYPTYAH